jgi:NADPH:quinone reductase-like Zn-dependent oxidoreductase
LIKIRIISLLIQLVKQFGAKVIATVRSDEKVSACLKNDADVAVNTTTDDFAAN